ncbi:2-hydroxychromene-2-carboxylate isomerase [Kordiimonas sp. SCSIO 12610]|uniref:2-hydroxychromene-2-carboxylate isomerase n=1 Tax=Kordiimonas sp. SCSIO 12610 TaxID=2829597 RepID=UPI00210A9E4F|nr:2-hydroxychromene-2-carboxylate isomerase [Kordiimonas sp. SCSIO 12610]UTW56708.1 2-hydroxychromene-2-carboxylate isomerase [Kordiimonas sp. SCSIO 12610]
MTKTIEFYFDFGSPTAYLAYKRLIQLQGQYGAKIEFRPMLLGGIFKATGNMSPVMIPAKGQYMGRFDLPRFARRYQVDFNHNPNFPINTLYLMRGYIAAEQMGVGTNYLEVMFNAMWVDEKNMGDMSIVTEVLSNAGIDAEKLLMLANTPEVKTTLIEATEAAVARGIFGAPTMFIGDEMYFGQDRLDFVEESLQTP